MLANVKCLPVCVDCVSLQNENVRFVRGRNVSVLCGARGDMEPEQTELSGQEWGRLKVLRVVE